MNEDFASRIWAEHRNKFADRSPVEPHVSLAGDIKRVGRALAIAFQRLNALQFDAPWLRTEVTHKPCTD
ncbi:MAG: hypothetical protein ABI898_09480 [Sphingomonadales bacterium]